MKRKGGIKKRKYRGKAANVLQPKQKASPAEKRR
jgi:hypothetical protein